MTHTPLPVIRIRAARPEDAPGLAALVEELGHPADPATIARQLSLLSSSANDRIIVAEDDGRLVGMSGMHIAIFIHRPRPVARLVTMVVTAQSRRSGVGRALVAHIERLAREQDCEFLELTSREERTEAHRFYESLGFRRTSARYWKAL